MHRQENGRSMIELIGVLAVVGLLTLVSLSLYTYLLNRHRANNTIHDVLLRGTNVPMEYEAYDLFEAGYVFDFPSLGDKTPDQYDVLTEKEDAASLYAYRVVVFDVPKRVCRMVLDLKPAATVYSPSLLEIALVKANTESIQRPSDMAAACQEENNTLFFYFMPQGAYPPDGGCTVNSCIQKCDVCNERTGKCEPKKCDEACQVCAEETGACMPKVCQACGLGQYQVGSDECDCPVCLNCPEEPECPTCAIKLYDTKGCVIGCQETSCCPAPDCPFCGTFNEAECICLIKTVQCSACQSKQIDPLTGCETCVSVACGTCSEDEKAIGQDACGCDICVPKDCPKAEPCGLCEEIKLDEQKCPIGCQSLCEEGQICTAQGTCAVCNGVILNPEKQCSNGQTAEVHQTNNHASMGTDAFGCCLSCSGEQTPVAYKASSDSTPACCFGKVNEKPDGGYICCPPEKPYYVPTYFKYEGVGVVVESGWQCMACSREEMVFEAHDSNNGKYGVCACPSGTRPVTQGEHRNICCSENVEGFYLWGDGIYPQCCYSSQPKVVYDDEGRAHCCPADKPYWQPTYFRYTDSGVIESNYECTACAKENMFFTADDSNNAKWGVCECPAGQHALSDGAYQNICCAESVTGFTLEAGAYPQCCSTSRPLMALDNDGGRHCCPADKPYWQPTYFRYTDSGVIESNYECTACAKENMFFTAEDYYNAKWGVCECPAGQHALSDSTYQNICCAESVTGFTLEAGAYPQCCSTSRPLMALDNDGGRHCCPADKPYWQPTYFRYTDSGVIESNYECTACAKENMFFTADDSNNAKWGVCECPAGQHALSDGVYQNICCAESVTGFTLEAGAYPQCCGTSTPLLTIDEDGGRHCCSTEKPYWTATRFNYTENGVVESNFECAACPKADFFFQADDSSNAKWGVCACPSGTDSVSIQGLPKMCCPSGVQGGYLWGGYYPQCCPTEKPIPVDDYLNQIQCCPSDKPQLTHPEGTTYTEYSLCCKTGESVVVTHSTMGGVGSVECCDKTVMSAGGHSYCCNPGETAYMYWAGVNFIDGGCCPSVLCPIEGQVNGNYGYACCQTGCGEKGYGCNDDGACTLGNCSGGPVGEKM